MPRSIDSKPAAGRRWRLGGVGAGERVGEAVGVLLWTDPVEAEPRVCVRERRGVGALGAAGAALDGRAGESVAEVLGTQRGRGGSAGAGVCGLLLNREELMEVVEPVRAMGVLLSVMVLRRGGNVGGADVDGPGTACRAETAD